VKSIGIVHILADEHENDKSNIAAQVLDAIKWNVSGQTKLQTFQVES
jgi:hypothetical protein